MRRQVLPGRPVLSLFKLRQGVRGCKNLSGCLYDLFYYIFFPFFLYGTRAILWQILNAMTHLAGIRVPEPQNNFKNNSFNFTWGHMGQIPGIQCFVTKFYMVAYVTKAVLGPEPSSHCCVGHSFGCRGLSNGATPLCTACTVYSFGSGVGIVVLADSRRQVLPGRQVLSLFELRQGV